MLRIRTAMRLTLAVLTLVGSVSIRAISQEEKATHSWPDLKAGSRVWCEWIDRQTSNNEQLAKALASLAVAARDESDIDEALKLFEYAEGGNKLPAQAKPYYGALLLRSSEHLRRERSIDTGGLSETEVILLPALRLLLDAYTEESGHDPIDARLLRDIALNVRTVYRKLGRDDKGIEWLKGVLSDSSLSDRLRAELSYELAVAYWKRAWDRSSSFILQRKEIPESDISDIRGWVTEGYSFIETAQTLAPDLANAWFYEKLLALQELNLEKDPETQKSIQKRAEEAQYRFLGILKQQRDNPPHPDNRPYSSGFPRLNVDLTQTPPPPPPPPPPKGPTSRK